MDANQPRVEEVPIPLSDAVLTGRVGLPADPAGLVIFAHGSGSSRGSPRNTFVAAALEKAGLATLLFDLLTVPEAADRANVFDIGLLADRLVGATRWARGRGDFAALPLGFFGASTGAAAALEAAARLGDEVSAVVSRGGRPDLAGPVLHQVTAPTLLIVGARDWPVIDMNRAALERLNPASRLELVARATHLFEEPGTLERVAVLASDWFTRHLGSVAPPRAR